jgi:hypothetical protein
MGREGPCTDDETPSRADRWMFTDMSPVGLCVAVSQTAGPMGAYYRYHVNMSDRTWAPGCRDHTCGSGLAWVVVVALKQRGPNATVSR